MKNWTLKTKILGTIGTVLTLLLLIGGLAVWAIGQLTRTSDAALTRLQAASDTHDIVISALNAYQEQADTIINDNTDPKGFLEHAKKLDQAIKQFAAVADTDEEKKWAGEMDTSSRAFAALYQQELMPLIQKMVQTTNLAESAKLEEVAKTVDGQTDKILASLESNAEKAIESLLKEAQVAKSGYVSLAGTIKWLVTVLAIATCVLGAVLGFFVAQGISRSVSRVAEDLSAGSEQTASAAAQVSSSSQSLAEGASESAASLEETSSSLEELSSMTQRNAENARECNRLMGTAKEVVGVMAQATNEMSQAISQIKTSSDETAKIIKTIDEIAFQTNILALNAAVEAARAGEAGAGFAVVADEVRSLAQRCAQAAKETAVKIEESVSKAGHGVQVTARVNESLQQTITNAGKVAQLVAEIASASQEQAQGITQINTAVSQMDKVTQSNAANAEESAAAAEELNAQAESMKEVVNELLRMVDGQGRRGGVSVASDSAWRKNGASPSTAATLEPAALSPGNGHQPNGQPKVHKRQSQPALVTANLRSVIPLEGNFKAF